MLTVMGKIFIASIFVFAFCTFVFGQNEKIVRCPKISVTEKSERVRGRNEITFSASVEDFNSGKIEYFWSTSDGAIISGQRTDTITVRANPNTTEFTPTVTVDIEGLAEGCQTSDSETAAIFCSPTAAEFDSFELTSNSINAEKLKALVSELENDPAATVSIIIYNKGESPSRSVKEKEAFIKKYLSDKKIADDRIDIVYSSESDVELVHIFIVPEGATPPIP